jgi:hypothetical protein
MPKPVVFQWLPNQEIGRTFLFKGLVIGTSSYFGADSTTKKNTAQDLKGFAAVTHLHAFLRTSQDVFSVCPNQEIG